MFDKKTISERQFNLLKTYVDIFNIMVQALKNEGIHLRDSKDFNFAIKDVYYSPAQDEVLVTFEEVEDKRETVIPPCEETNWF